VYEGRVSILDILPTMLAQFGVETPEGYTGKPLPVKLLAR